MCWFFPARKLRNCYVRAVLGLDREIPDLSTPQCYVEVSWPIFFASWVLFPKPLWSIDLKSAALHCKRPASVAFFQKAAVSQRRARSWAEIPLHLAQPCRGAGPQRAPAPAVTAGMVMSSQLEFPALLPWSSLAVHIRLLLGRDGAFRPRELNGLPVFFKAGRGIGGPSGSSVWRCQEPTLRSWWLLSKKIHPRIFLWFPYLIEILSAVIHRVASNPLVPVVWVRGFFKACFIM